MPRAAFLAQVPDTPQVPTDVRLMNVTASVLLAVFVVGALALAVNWATRHPRFSLKRIDVEGDVGRNSVSSIRQYAATKLRGNFFTTDLNADRRAFETVPWVRHALVRRVWPNRLVVELEEHKPAAVWSGGKAAEKGSDRLVNSFGEVFEARVNDSEEDELPVLRGPDGSAAHVLTMWQRLVPMFAKLSAKVDALAMSQRGSWKVELDNGARVELGRGSDDEVLARAERFIATVPQITGRYQRGLKYADLRHNGAYAVKLEGITTAEPGEETRRRRRR